MGGLRGLCLCLLALPFVSAAAGAELECTGDFLSGSDYAVAFVNAASGRSDPNQLFNEATHTNGQQVVYSPSCPSALPALNNLVEWLHSAAKATGTIPKVACPSFEADPNSNNWIAFETAGDCTNAVDMLNTLDDNNDHLLDSLLAEANINVSAPSIRTKFPHCARYHSAGQGFFVYSAYAEAFLQKASGGIDISEVPLSEGYSTLKSDDCANARVLIQALLDQLAEENPSMGNAPELLCQSNLEFHDVPDCTKAMNLFDTVEGYLDNSYTTPTTFLEKLRVYGDQKAWVAEYRWDLNSGSTQCDGCPQPTDGQDAAALHGDGATFVPNDGKQVLHIDGSIDSYMSLDTLKLGGGPFTACARISLDRYPGTNEIFFPWEFGIGQYHMQQIFMEIRHESDVTTNSMNIVMILSVENKKRNGDDLHFSRLHFRISENEFQLNTWHHVCGIIEDTKNRENGPNPNPMKIYLDGSLVEECTEDCIGTMGKEIAGQVPNRLLRTQNFIGRSAFGGSAFSTKYGESVFAGMLSNLVVVDGAAWGAADVQAEMEIAAEAATTTSTSTSTSTTIDLRAAEDLKSPTNESDKETTIRFDVNIEKETVKKKFVKELVGGGAAIIALIIMYVINWYAKKQGMEGTPITCGKVEFRGFDIKLNCCNCSTAAKEELEDFPYYHGEVEEEQGMEKNEGGLKKAKEVLKNRTPGDFIVIKFITANPLQKKYRLFVLKESGGAEAAAEPTLFIKLKQAHIDGPWLFSKVTQPVTLEPNFDKHKETGCSFLNDAIEHIVNLTDELNSSCLTETENGIEIEGREFACFDFSQSESTADNNPTKARKRPPSKFVANEIRLGQATQSAAGLADLMGYTTMSIMGLIFGNGGGVEAIVHEVTMSGTEEDKKNLKGLMDGTYTNPPHSDGSPQTPE
eukprot:gene13846-34134_t